MLPALAIVSIPVLPAAGLDSAGFGLMAIAGLFWIAALYLCSIAPVVAGHSRRSVNETLTYGLTTLAMLAGTAGVAVALFGL